MRIVIADTGPINYLILIGAIDVIPVLFGGVILPFTVCEELRGAPDSVTRWLAAPPEWLQVHAAPAAARPSSEYDLDPGEQDAIALALELHADLILIDDREGVLAARSRGLEVIGTLGILGLAAQKGLLHLRDAFERIKQTNFRYRQSTWDALLKADSAKSRFGRNTIAINPSHRRRLAASVHSWTIRAHKPVRPRNACENFQGKSASPSPRYFEERQVSHRPSLITTLEPATHTGRMGHSDLLEQIRLRRTRGAAGQPRRTLRPPN